MLTLTSMVSLLVRRALGPTVTTSGGKFAPEPPPAPALASTTGRTPESADVIACPAARSANEPAGVADATTTPAVASVNTALPTAAVRFQRFISLLLKGLLLIESEPASVYQVARF